MGDIVQFEKRPKRLKSLNENTGIRKKKPGPKRRNGNVFIAIVVIALLAAFLYHYSKVMVFSESSAYDRIYSELSNHETIISISEPIGIGDGDGMLDIFDQVVDDHPELFWLTGSALIESENSFVITDYRLNVNTRCDMDKIPDMEEALDRVVKHIVNKANKKYKTDYKKAKYVHDYLVKKCDYDEATYEKYQNDPTDGTSMAYTAYGCLIDHKAVCEGYSKAYKLILDKLGIECGIVTGTASNSLGESGDHEWNYIKLDDGYYMVDVTWDDPIGYDESKVREDYFCLSTDEISKNHSIDEGQNIPECNGMKY